MIIAAAGGMGEVYRYIGSAILPGRSPGRKHWFRRTLLLEGKRMVYCFLFRMLSFLNGKVSGIFETSGCRQLNYNNVQKKTAA
jgi:hypothetical protein